MTLKGHSHCLFAVPKGLTTTYFVWAWPESLEDKLIISWQRERREWMPGVKIKGKHQIVGRILGQNREVYLGTRLVHFKSVSHTFMSRKTCQVYCRSCQGVLYRTLSLVSHATRTSRKHMLLLCLEPVSDEMLKCMLAHMEYYVWYVVWSSKISLKSVKFSFLNNRMHYFYCYILQKTPLKLVNWFQRYEQLKDAKNSRKQKTFTALFSSILKSIFPTSDWFCLITSHIWLKFLLILVKR